MELTKHPETEAEYWQTIEALGGFAWGANHDLADGRLEDPDGSLDREIASARELSRRLVTELTEKFGVIPPDECPKVSMGETPPPAPEGKRYYWDWYHEQKRLAYGREYDGMICSACPLSEGVDQMISLGGVVPCSVFRGMMYRLTHPSRCGMLDTDHWSEEQLLDEIGKAAAVAARKRFLEKQESLKEASVA